MTTITTLTMSEREARKLTERIRVTAHNYTEAKEKLLALVQEAKDGGAHEALGYKSWTAYLAEVLGDEPLRLARDDRQEMVKALSAEGMSTRAIAPIVGASREQVRRDISTDTFVSVDEPRISHGLDGKSRTHQPRPEPAPEPTEPPKPKRRPLTDQAGDAGWEIRKATEKLQRIFEDDRLGRNKEEVAAHLRGHLMYATETLQGFLDIINNK